jgi:FemAB-related protein (PEP-CTERM system-associated)
MTLAMCERDVRVMRVTPETDAITWRRMARDLNGVGLAHAVEWAGIISEVYGHRPLYVAAHDEMGHSALLPAVVVRRPFFGTVVASMPFLDGGGPCSSSPALATSLVETLIHEARRIGADRVELRSGQRLAITAQPQDHKVNMVLALPQTHEELWNGLGRSVRDQVRKAERSGVSLEWGGAESLSQFYWIYASRMRDLGSPPHDRAFFNSTLDHFGVRAQVLLARKGSTTIGGLIALVHRDTMVVPWAASLKMYAGLSPNVLLYWEALRAGCAKGLREFDFGRSTRGSSTYKFKRQWGAAESPLFWYSLAIRGREEPVRSVTAARAAARLVQIWRHVPVGLTGSVGPLVRRYITQ